jgi:hypothetical protein
MLEEAEASSYLTADQASALSGWSLDPKAWSDKA